MTASRTDQQDSWRHFVADETADRLVLAARAVAPERARERADLRIIQMVRAHHLQLERLLVDAAGDDIKAWAIQVAYRGDTAIIACDRSRFADLVVVAWSMVDQNTSGSGLPTCIGLSAGDVLEVAGFRPELSTDWSPTLDLQGLAIERALGLVHDFASESQVLLCGDLVDAFDGDDIGGRIPTSAIAEVKLKPVKEQALVLHADLEAVPVGQMIWDGVGPGDLTNRHVLGRELKDLQPKVTKIVEFFALISGTLKEVYSSEAGAFRTTEIDEPLLVTAQERVDDVLSAWRETREAQQQPELAAKLERLKREFSAVVQRFRDLKAAISHDDSGRRSDARENLQDAWFDCRATAPEVLEDVTKLVKDLYT